MSLSEAYSDIDSYLNDVLQFLNDCRWIYATSNTEIVVHGTLRQIPADWIPTIESLSLEELNEIPFDYTKASWPLSLRALLATIERLKPTATEKPINLPQNNAEDVPFCRGIKSKKVHEIYELSNEISRHCIDSAVFIDLGCGVGHLTQYLHRKFHYKMLGIDADSERVQTAENIQKAKFADSQSSVKFVQHFIESSSASFIKSLVIKEFNLNSSPDLVLTGLHACADLTVTSLDLFLRDPNVIKLLIMPCCYHKMKYKANSLDEFQNIPLSKRVKSAQHAKDIINRPFLRLAGQQTALRWRNNTESEHREHGRNMFIRGVVQAVLKEDEMVLKKKKLATHGDCAENASENAFAQYTLIDKHTKGEKPWSNGQKLEFDDLLRQYPNGGILCEFLTGLQASIQSICENLVILDRLLYVKEEAEKLQLNVNIFVKKIVKEEISPRCFVIIAEKNK